MPIRLTFGVQLKFTTVRTAVETRPLDHEAYVCLLPSAKATEEIISHISNAISVVNLPSNVTHLSEPEPTVWSIQASSFSDESTGNDIYQRITLKSPAYYFTPESLLAISLMCKTLNKHFCMLPETQVLRVYVGNENKGFTFQALGNLVVLAVLMAPTLNSMHPGNSQPHLLTFSDLGFASKVETLIYIYGCKSESELLDLMRSGDSSLKLNRLDKRENLEDRVSKTIEWVQKRAMLDSGMVCHWIRVVVWLMELAMEADEVSFLDSMAGYAVDGKKDLDIGVFLRSVGAVEAAEFYEEIGIAKGAEEMEREEHFRMRLDEIFDLN